MKKQGLLHYELARTIASMGHADMLVIADAGLPVPPGVPCIDLAVTAGVPPFLDVLRAVATELEVERLSIAHELAARGGSLPEAIQGCFPQARLEYLTHEQLKALSREARAVVRTGEFTPYANVVLWSGVVF